MYIQLCTYIPTKRNQVGIGNYRAGLKLSTVIRISAAFLSANNDKTLHYSS